VGALSSDLGAELLADPLDEEQLPVRSKVLDAEHGALSHEGRLILEALVEERQEVLRLQVRVEVSTPPSGHAEGSLRAIVSLLVAKGICPEGILVVVLSLLRSLLQDVERDQGSLSHRGAFVLGVGVEQGLDDEVDVWVGDVGQGKGLDDALLGLHVVDESGLALVLFDQRDHLLFALGPQRDDGLCEDLSVVVPLLEELEEDGQALLAHLSPEAGNGGAGSRTNLPVAVLESVNDQLLGLNAHVLRGEPADGPNDHALELGLLTRPAQEVLPRQAVDTARELRIWLPDLPQNARYDFLDLNVFLLEELLAEGFHDLL
jgi:hypothetical protein